MKWYQNILIVALLSVGFASCSSDDGMIPSFAESNQEQPVLEEILQIAEEKSINKLTIDWQVLKEDVLSVNNEMGFNNAIGRLLELLGDNHSFYILANGVIIRRSSISCERDLFISREDLPDNPEIGYLNITGFSGTPEEAIRFADDIQTRMEMEDADDLKGWVIDLSGNGGGNMYPMIAGLGPLLGEEVLGYFIDPENQESPWGYDNGASYFGNTANRITSLSVPYELKSKNTKIAVITSKRTASSGEAIAISFIGKENTRLFGMPSCGLSTANQSFVLSDNSTLVLTVSTMADRNKNPYGGQVIPDEIHSDLNQLSQGIASWLLD